MTRKPLERHGPGSSDDPCDHGVRFPETREGELAALQHLTTCEIRECFPRLFGRCPKGCGFSGIAYASKAHYVGGNW